MGNDLMSSDDDCPWIGFFFMIPSAVRLQSIDD